MLLKHHTFESVMNPTLQQSLTLLLRALYVALPGAPESLLLQTSQPLEQRLHEVGNWKLFAATMKNLTIWISFLCQNWKWTLVS